MDALQQQAVAAVDQLLIEQGAYCPVELLLLQGRLQYRDYEAWRSGEEESLEPLLFGNQQRTLQLLEYAEQYAVDLGLESQTASWNGWGDHSSTALQIGARKLSHALRANWQRHQPAETGDQFDLFFDNGELIAANRVRQALSQRDSANATRALQQLSTLNPDHPDLGELEQLNQVLDAPPPPAETLLHHLQHSWRAAAERQLGSYARDWLMLMWKRLAQQLEQAPFNPQQPQLHNSWVYLQREEWRAVRAAIEQEPGWKTVAILADRYATASWQLGEREMATMLRFQLCWSSPRYAQEMVEADEFNDKLLYQSWRELADLEQDDLEQEYTAGIALLPQYSMIQRPALLEPLGAQMAAFEPSTIPSDWEVLIRLLHAPQEIALRSQLRDHNPLLFELFMRR